MAERVQVAESAVATGWRASGAPAAVTAVVVPLLGGRALAACVEAVREQGVRVIVVGDGGIEPDADTAVIGAGGQTVPQRRQTGAQAAGTEIVALIEDTTLPGPGWVAAIRDGFADPAIAGLGGPVTISDDLPPRYRALGYCEYGRFQSACFADLGSGARTAGGLAAVSALPGNNFAFRRADLLAALACLDDGLIDGEVFAGLARQGRTLAYHPGMGARYVQPHADGARLATRFQHGRLFGGRRLAGRSALARCGFALAAAALPAVLTGRTLRHVPRDRRRSLPLLGWILMQHGAWAAGEAVGYLAGVGRHSLRRWR